MINHQSMFKPQGWECPVCKSVNAPFIARCPCSINKPASIALEVDTADQEEYLQQLLVE